MIRNYFKTAFRNLWRNKGFSLINIVGLSVGLACCMLIFLYTMDEVSYDRFNTKAANIYHLTATFTNPSGQAHHISSTGQVHGPSFKDKLPEFESFVRLQNAHCTIKKANDVFDEDALFADDNFFSVFTFPLLQGSPQTALKDLHSVVLSEEIAEKYFGKKDAV